MKNHVQDPGAILDLGADFRRGADTPVELVRRLFRRIEEKDPDVKAWLYVDEDDALEQAARCTREIRNGAIRSPLHGIPIAIKDIIDLAGLPTRANSPSRRSVAPAAADANIVSSLRAAGAIILGKVHTTEYAYFSGPPPTRNPWDLDRTPGGSSAGSAAAVASGTVPCSIGTQTAASVIRPAAYCGIAAFKPTSQSLSMQGILPLAPSFDTPGWFGYRVADVLVLWEAIHGSGRVQAQPAGDFTIGYLDDAEIRESASPETWHHMTAVCDAIGRHAFHVETPALPVSLSCLNAWHKTVFEYELAQTQGHLLAGGEGRVEQPLLDAIQRGMVLGEQEYLEKKSRIREAQVLCWRAWERCDLLMLPATPDVAPIGMQTGDPSYITPFTVLGGPIVAMPTGLDGRGLPMGTMLCARPYDDRRLLACALSLAAKIELARSVAAA